MTLRATWNTILMAIRSKTRGSTSGAARWGTGEEIPGRNWRAVRRAIGLAALARENAVTRMSTDTKSHKES
jgi:hypothetical protein